MGGQGDMLPPYFLRVDFLNKLISPHRSRENVTVVRLVCVKRRTVSVGTVFFEDHIILTVTRFSNFIVH